MPHLSPSSSGKYFEDGGAHQIADHAIARDGGKEDEWHVSEEERVEGPRGDVPGVSVPGQPRYRNHQAGKPHAHTSARLLAHKAGARDAHPAQGRGRVNRNESRVHPERGEEGRGLLERVQESAIRAKPETWHQADGHWVGPGCGSRRQKAGRGAIKEWGMGPPFRELYLISPKEGPRSPSF